MKRLVIGMLLAGATASLGQVSITGRESPDQTAAAAAVTLQLRDRQVAPLIVETQTTQIEESLTRTDRTTRALRADGTYFDWRTAVTTERKIDEGTRERVNEVRQTGREGDARVIQKSVEVITTTPDGGQRAEIRQFRPTSSGALVLERIVSAVTTKTAEDSQKTRQVESRVDVNGALRPVQQIEEVVTRLGENASSTERSIRSFSHIEGEFATTARELEQTRVEGNTTVREKTIQQPAGGGVGWRAESRIVETETRAEQGSVRREITEFGRPLYGQSAEARGAGEQLVPRRKVIVTELRAPDGTVRLERQVFRRDVNGEWKPSTFSTEQANLAY